MMKEEMVKAKLSVEGDSIEFYRAARIIYLKGFFSTSISEVFTNLELFCLKPSIEEISETGTVFSINVFLRM